MAIDTAELTREPTADLWKGHWSRLGMRGPPRLYRLLSFSFSLSVSVFLPLRLLQCGGGELIIGAVKPSHSVVSVSNEVSVIKAL